MRNIDLIHYAEDGTKLIIPSKITPPFYAKHQKTNVKFDTKKHLQICHSHMDGRFDYNLVILQLLIYFRWR